MTMADEGPAQTETTSPTAGTAEAEPPADTEGTAQGEGEAEGEAPEGGETDQPIDFVELEFGGKTYKVPPELKTGFMMQADYTQKTQAVAEQKRAVEAQAAEQKAQTEAAGAHFNRYVELSQLDNALQQYANIDWRALEARDPVQAQTVFREWTQIKDARAAVVGQLQQDERKRLDSAKADTGRRLQETRRVAERDINGWTPEVDAKVAEFARSFGLTDQELVNVIDPRTYKILHLAWLGSQLGQKTGASQTSSASANSTPEIRPLKQVAKARSAPPSGALSDKMDPEEWVKKRNEQVRRANGRA